MKEKDENIKELQEKIEYLKKEKKVTLLAHFYQTLEVQAVADYIGDSLGLSKIAKAKITTPYILFAAVKFMGETAAILNPDKTVLSPDLRAGCPLAGFLTGESLKKFKEKYPGLPVVVYVNTTAETKAEANICCTSSNAINIVKKTAEHWNSNRILFGPDKNLADYVRKKTGLDIITIPGHGMCPRHDLFTLDDVEREKNAHPNAALLVHPESPPSVVEKADSVGSTAGIEKYVINHPETDEFIIGTEVGMVDYLAQKYPDKKFYPLSTAAVCTNMKKITLKKILKTLESIGTHEEELYKIKVPKDISERAIKSIDLMMDFS